MSLLFQRKMVNSSLDINIVYIMAILDRIRKKTTILILIVGLALFAFVISGIFSANTFSGTKVGSSVAEVNGTDISIDDFRAKVDIATRNSGASNTSMQIINAVYEKEIRSALLEQQFDELRISVEQDQIVDYLRASPSYSQLPQFLNEEGAFDENKFIELITNLKENNPLGYQDWLQTEKSIIQNTKENIYFNLIKSGLGTTPKEVEMAYKLANDRIDINYVRVPFASIDDNSIDVSKSEIEAYIEKHEDDFKQEASRDIQFVYFKEKASLNDEKQVQEKITALLEDSQLFNEAKDTTETIPGFRNSTDMFAFLDLNSDVKFDTIYKPQSSLPAAYADTLVTLPIGEIYGPYRDANAFKVSKMIGKKSDGNVKASHILISYEGAQNAKADIKRTKEEAEKRAKEILISAKQADSIFADLAKKYSDDPSGPKGGDLGFFQEGTMVTAFNDFAFGNKVGTIGLVETDFGFHVIKIEEKQDLYQIANLVREIEPSQETINLLFQDVTKFEMQTMEGKQSFTDFAKTGNYVVQPINKIKEMDENLPQLGAQRNIVQWAFGADTKSGEIKRFDLASGYAIVQLTAKYEKGLMTAEDASATVLPKLRKTKKAAQIVNNNKGKSIQTFAKDNNVSEETATALTVTSPTIPGAGREPEVVGTAYALGEGKSSGLIVGESGVFMVTVTKKTAAAADENYNTFSNNLKRTKLNRVNNAVYQALKSDSKIEDKRGLFY